MKKIVAALLILPVLCLFCGCGVKNTGAVHELCNHSWGITQRSGERVSLTFSGERACFCMKNSKDTAKIEGRYLACDGELVIFVPQIARSYGFSYTPHGKYLDLSYQGEHIRLKKR